MVDPKQPGDPGHRDTSITKLKSLRRHGLINRRHERIAELNNQRQSGRGSRPLRSRPPFPAGGRAGRRPTPHRARIPKRLHGEHDPYGAGRPRAYLEAAREALAKAVEDESPAGNRNDRATAATNREAGTGRAYQAIMHTPKRRMPVPTMIDAIREDASVSTAAALAISNGRAPTGWSIEDDGDADRFRTMQNGVERRWKHPPAQRAPANVG